MSTLCTAFPSFPGEGDIPLNTLKNCAKTTAKINMQKTIPIDELRPSWKSHLEFYAFSSRPPYKLESCSGAGLLRCRTTETGGPVTVKAIVGQA